MQELRYPIIIHWSEEDKKYLASLPDFPYCTTHGDTPEEALKNGIEVLEMLIEGSRADNEPLPEPKQYAA